ncbi:hypothetical protein GXP67_03625 [Rhodocytophaga rosea]|uniref:Uncharacterized protein n=1 Tax=Rhodocytophaga rosea TaxID=2704465 RepID=A0A6C0GCW0_9BACT|nr:hypothetical protein [Rhodocytophaga rosea]QHT65819.1 hypothetical protein GXP67_03625 [Rhodocytophaga rosea]
MEFQVDNIKLIHAGKIDEMLSLIHKRPTIFLTSKSISSFQNFLNGYLIWAFDNDEIYNPSEPGFGSFK